MHEKRLAEIVASRVIALPPSASVAEAMRLMESNGVSCVPVLADKRPVGILTERNIVLSGIWTRHEFERCQVQDMMSAPVRTANRNMALYEAYNVLISNEIRHLIVIDDTNRAVGVLTLSDIIKHLGYEYFVEMRTLSKIMTKVVLSVSRDATVQDAVTAMAIKSISCLIVTEKNRPLGILTERDITRMLLRRRDIGLLRVADVMTSPVETATADTPVLDAAEIMRRKNIRRIVVVDSQGELLGLATQSNVVKGLESQYIQHLKLIVKEKDLTLKDALLELSEKSLYIDNILRSSIDIGIVATQHNNRIAYYNPAAERILGKRRQEVLGRDIWEIHQNYGIKKSEFDNALAAARKKKRHTFTFERQKKSGMQIIEAVVSWIPDKQEQVAGYVLTLRDITKQKMAEEALRVNEERFRLSFENARDAIFWANTSTGMLTNCNKGAELLLEKERGEIIGQHQTTLFPAEKVAAYARIFNTGIKREGSVDNEAEVITKSGQRKPVHITASVSLVDGETITQGIFRDISKRKCMEKALRESEKKYSTLVENSLIGIYIDQDQKIVFANKKFADIYRYPKEELVNMPSWKLVHPDDRNLTDLMRTKRLDGLNIPQEYEARGLRKNGATIWIKRRNTRIEYNGRPAILGNIVDITERKKAEEELHRINEELKDFVHVISHDLKNPLLAVQGFSARLINKFPKQLGLKGLEYVKHIHSNTLRMDHLVSDLLTFSKVGRLVSSFRHIACHDIIRRIIPTLQNRLEDKRIRLLIAEDLPVIYCCREKMHQVFENLLTNAIKYIGNNGSPQIAVGSEDKGDCHQFFVRDNGIGIDRQYHRLIFEKFRRLENVDDEGGSGLGLAIVEKIVTGHGGKIWVESAKGMGATFYFTLPKGPAVGEAERL